MMAGRPKKAAFEWPTAESKKQAAQILGWPESRLDECQKAGAPGFRHGRVYIGELIAWLGRKGLDDADLDWSRELKKEQTLKLRDERAEREKRTLDFAVVRVELQRIDARFWTEHERMQHALPPKLKGKTEPEIAGALAEAFEKLKAELRAMCTVIEADVELSTDGDASSAIDSANPPGIDPASPGASAAVGV